MHSWLGLWAEAAQAESCLYRSQWVHRFLCRQGTSLGRLAPGDLRRRSVGSDGSQACRSRLSIRSFLWHHQNPLQRACRSFGRKYGKEYVGEYYRENFIRKLTTNLYSNNLRRSCKNISLWWLGIRCLLLFCKAWWVTSKTSAFHESIFSFGIALRCT